MKVASRIGHLSRQARHMSGRAEFRDALSQGLASLYAHDMRGAAKSLSESYALLSSANNGADPRGAELDRNPDAAAVLNAIGIMHFRRGDFHKADTLLRESLGIYQRNYETGMGNDAYRDLGGCLNDLVLTCFRLEDYETAEKQLKRCMYMSTRAYNPDKTLVGVTLCNMGRLCLHRGEFADAKTWLVKGCAQLKEAMRNNSLHKEVMGDAQASAALADPKQAKGGEADSNDDILQSSADLGSCLLDLSIVQSRLGNFEAAGKCLRQAADLFNTSAANGGDDTPARNPDYARYLNAMALLNIHEGQFVEAQRLCVDASDILGETLGQQHADYGMSIVNLGLLSPAPLAAEYLSKGCAVLSKAHMDRQSHSVVWRANHNVAFSDDGNAVEEGTSLAEKALHQDNIEMHVHGHSVDASPGQTPLFAYHVAMDVSGVGLRKIPLPARTSWSATA